MIGKDPVQEVAGYSASVHEALLDLADMPVSSSARIEVSDPNHP